MLIKKFKISALFIALLFSFSGLQATRYWVGNAGNWSDPAHWSKTSGGSPGASLPNEFDVVIFDANSFTSPGQTVTIDKNIAIAGMDWLTATNSPRLTGALQFQITLYGPVFFPKNFTNDFEGEVIFVFATPSSPESNFYDNEFKGKVEGKYDPYNNVLKKIQKGKGNSVLTAITDFTVNYSDADCGCNGWISVATITGGTAPFTYTYTPAGPYSGEPTDSIYNLCPQTYGVRIRDADGHQRLEFQAIGGPPTGPFSIVFDPSVDNTCFQSCDGEIVMSQATGGYYPYTYSWNTIPVQTDSIADNLCAGIYTVTATDNAGCVQTFTDTVAEPTAVAASIASQTNVDCGGRSTGSATATASGGTAPYTYRWYDAGGTLTALKSSLAAGTYNCEVTDANGCKDTATVIITEPTPLSITAITNQNILCNGVCIGQVAYLGSGGTGALTYSWYDIAGTPTITPVSNLCAGTYNVEITDANGCKDTAATAITQPGALTATIIASTNVMCRGLCTGSATVSAAGGTVPYTYDWYNLFAQTTAVGTGMCAGASNVEVTDANGCKDTATVIITQPATILFADIVSQTNNVCFGDCLGDAIVRSSGGTAPHTYNWYDTPGLETDTFAANLCANTYHVEVTDGNGCLDTATVSITEPSAVVGNFTDSIPLGCNGDCNGSLTVSGSGGTPGYTYLWLAPAGPVVTVVAGLCAGTYSVRVTDAIGCTGVGTYVLVQPAVLNAAMASQTNITCNGLCNGQLTAGPSGGTLPYSYDWYDYGGITTVNAPNLCVGTYNVEVTDANGCIDTATASITQPAALVASIASSTDLVCGSVCNGTATAGVVGGTAAYSYNWYDGAGQTTVMASNLCGGTYNVEVTDFNGCKDTATVIINAPAALTVSIASSTNVLCNGECNGAATAAGVGGSAPLTYSWYDAPVDPAIAPIANLCPGTYNVEVSDASGCKDTATAIITEPFALTLTPGVPTNPGCFGVCNGVATVAPSGGTAPYTYNWYDAGGQTTITAAALCAGTYNVEVTDANGCKDTLTFIITQPASPLDIALISVTPVTCNGICDGSATVLASGGTAAYTYLWYDSPGNSTQSNLGSLCFGTFHAEATDANGCKDTVTVPITAPVVVVASITDSTNVNCNGMCDGDATVAAAGGTVPYTYNWTTAGNQNTTVATNLCSQLHSVTITDANGCIDIATVNITQPTAVVGTITDSTNISCNGVCIGDATVAAAGGNGPYNYLWYDVAGNPVTTFISNLCSGTYHAEITDASGCLDTVSVNITEPPVLSAAITKTNITCNGLCNGTMTALPTSGGTIPYTYNWYDDAGQITINISGLCVVTRNVEVTDANGCIDTATAAITQPLLLTSSVADSTSPTCVGICDGDATAAPAGGTAPYAFLWYTSGNQVNTIATNMCAGAHFVRITDANGCRDTLPVTITAPIVVIASMVDSSVTACAAVCTGTAHVTAVGGLLPYTFDWFTAGNQNDSLATNLCAGTNQVIVNDANGCEDTASVVIGISNNPVIATITDSTATGCATVCSGTATVAGSGGTGPYTYNWFTAGGQIGAMATALCFGTDEVIVTDAIGCFDTTSVTINLSSTPIVATIVDSNGVSCFGDCDGSATVNGAAGVAPYTFNWYSVGGSVNDTVAGLCPGTYGVEVTDAIGCFDTASVVIISPLPLTIAKASNNPVCNGDNSGTASIVPSGGTLPYTHQWSNGSTSAILVNLAPGIYIDTVTDANGCTAIDSVIISDPVVVQTNAIGGTVSCPGMTDGMAYSLPSGGTGPFTFSWNTGSTNDSITGLAAGIYTVIVTDSVGCADTSSVTVITPPALALSMSHVDAVCICNGSAEVTVAGGTPPYTYLWNDFAAQTVDSATALCAGNYEVKVQDAFGCRDSIPVSILNTSTLTGSVVDSIPTTCFTTCDGSGMVVASLGQAPYTYLWNDLAATANDTAINLCAGAYIAQVTDANSCIYNISVTITSPPAINGVSSVIMPLCFGDCNGTATLVPAGGNGGPYTHNWDVGSANDSIFNLCAGTYNDTLTDGSGCTGVVAVVVNQPTLLIAAPVKTNVTCNGAGNGTANANASGGNLPYTYLWDDAGASTTATISGLTPGTYRVTVTDANGCSDLDSVIITEPLPLTSIMQDSTTVNCSCDGKAKVVASGGTLPYTYLWNDLAAQTADSAVALCAGNYTVAVTDANGCATSSSVQIIDISGFSASITGVVNLKCNAICIGSATISTVGGTLPYSFTWNDPAAQTDSTAINLCAGNYTGIVTDAAGCQFVLPTAITQPSAIAIAVVTTNVTCSGACDGQLLATASGGTGSTYTYSWNDPLNQNTPLADTLCPATYILTVTDSVGCIKTSNNAVTEPLPLVAFISSVTNVTCNGDCDGSINSIGVAGTAPYTYAWDSGPITKNISGLCPNNYKVTVTDANGCVDDSTQAITEPTVLNANLTDSSKITCFSFCDGTATAIGTGGTAPYTYSWYDSPGNQTTAKALNLCATTYHAKVTDAHGCKDTTQVVFVPPLQLTLTEKSKTPAICFNECNGTAVVEGLGGTGALTYTWTGGQTGTSPVTLCAGVNTVTVKDANNCSKTLNVNIGQPAAALTVLLHDTIHLLCANICDGEITATASGGNGGYTYQWDDPSLQTTPKATGLCAGTFNVVVKDAKNCQTTAPVDINTANSLTATITPTLPLCFGDCNGSVKVKITGGVKPYSVNWIGPGNASGATTLTVPDLCKGSYTVTVKDASATGCPQVKNQVLGEPPLLDPQIGSDSVNILCKGLCTGTATAIGNGGTPPWTYKWNDPASQATDKAVGLCAGQHKVDVTDANGCMKPVYVNLTEPATAVSVNHTTTPALCTNTNEGTIDETVAGGVIGAGGYDYSWTGPKGYTSTIEDPLNLYPGQYILTVKDDNNCAKKDTAIITAVTFIDANAGNDTTICDLDTANLKGSGGLNFSWNTTPVKTTSSIAVTPSSTTAYYLTVTSAGCIDKDTVIVTVNPKPTAQIDMAKTIILEGSSQTLFGFGAGIGGTYDWSPPISLNDPTLQNPTATPLKNTKYILTVTTAAGCSDSISMLLKVAKGIVFPDGITPNGDGKNDTWVIDLIDQFPQCKVEIFNRWGQQIFQSSGYTESWEGLFNHIPLPVGTYYYVIDLGPGLPKYTGPITLMR